MCTQYALREVSLSWIVAGVCKQSLVFFRPCFQHKDSTPANSLLQKCVHVLFVCVFVCAMRLFRFGRKYLLLLSVCGAIASHSLPMSTTGDVLAASLLHTILFQCMCRSKRAHTHRVRHTHTRILVSLYRHDTVCIPWPEGSKRGE